MFEKFTSADARDFATRYQGTYGFFYRDGVKKFLVRLEVVDQTVRFVDRAGIPYDLMPDSQEDTGFEFLPPKSGFFNTDIGAVYVERRATRQFSRGISDRNTRLYQVNGPAGGMVSIPVNFKNLEKVYNSKITTAEAYKAFAEKINPSCALSPQFAIDESRVYIFSNIIGRVSSFSKDKISLKLENDLFKTEIRDNARGVAEVEFA